MCILHYELDKCENHNFKVRSVVNSFRMTLERFTDEEKANKCVIMF